MNSAKQLVYLLLFAAVAGGLLALIGALLSHI